MRRIRPLAWVLLAAGAALLALSFVPEPTPTTYATIHLQGHLRRVPVNDDNAVDYAIGLCRLAGVVTDDRRRLSRLPQRASRTLSPWTTLSPPSSYDQYVNISPIHGDPSGRSGIG